MTEEDVKNKIILPFLKGLGFTEEKLSFEDSFKIKLGRGKHEVGKKKSSTVHSDILVKEVENLNRNRVKLLGFISNNEEISKINITGGNLIDLPRENLSYQEAKEIFAKII